ncbi:MAG: Gfo/Idh/MocA family oxidoreductase [Flavobacteriales bacterium]|nr:Gfo/Idh/MocA family oxidoreductase [Flavobacteriales bacterium]
MKNFALIGTAGYIAPRHLQAIKETEGNLLASIDVSDNVGILDKYFPKSYFFTNLERFDRHIEKLKLDNQRIDFFTICSPNFLHDFHIRYALKNNSDVICEKPTVLNPWNYKALEKSEEEYGKQVFSILQLRLHPKIIELKNKISKQNKDKIYDVDLTYITSRGSWYYTSWKGDIEKSGGIATNIGIHFFDILTWIFGDVEKNTVHIRTHDRVAGFLQLKNANVRWFLSINSETLPEDIKEIKTTYRSIKIEGEELEFSDGFENLHTLSYQEILKGNGFKLKETEKSVDITYQIRNLNPLGLVGEYHPFAKLPLTRHPFL